MDELGGFTPDQTTGFITSALHFFSCSRPRSLAHSGLLTRAILLLPTVESIRLKKWGQAREKAGKGIEPKDVY